MSTPRPPKPARLVIGVLTADKRLMPPVAKTLSERFGPVELMSAWMPFEYTEYYTAEMGAPLHRRVFSFKKLIRQADLAAVKVFTNALEREYLADDGGRRVNIDPGYMALERFVLATGKNFTHRIYIGGGIYADLTLIYAKGRFQRLPWTYPDYADRPMITLLEQIRRRYAHDMKALKP